MRQVPIAAQLVGRIRNLSGNSGAILTKVSDRAAKVSTWQIMLRRAGSDPFMAVSPQLNEQTRYVTDI